MLNLISGKEIVGRINDKFNLDYTDWINRTPLLIADALRKINIPMTYEKVRSTVILNGYIGDLPYDLNYLDAVSYNGEFVDKLEYINNNITDIPNQGVIIHFYTLDLNRHITFTIQDAELVLYYRRLPCVFDFDRNIYFPSVPDNIFVIEAIEWYIIMSLLIRGHKHPIYEIGSNNPFLNPQIQWETSLKKARNAIGFTKEDRLAINVMKTSFITDFIDYKDINFVPNITIS